MMMWQRWRGTRSRTRERRLLSKKDEPKKRRRISKRNVLLWSNFEQTKDPYKVICKASPSCNAKIRRPDGSTFGMLAHFEARHSCPVNGIYCKIQKTMEETVSNL
jgi:hypothetical protein